MKALIKSGLCVAFGWFANSATAQDVPIKWQAKSPSPIVTPAPSDSGARTVGLSQPVPLGSGGAFAPIIRMQAPDDKKPQPLPAVEIFVEPEPKVQKKASGGAPGPKKNNGFTPPPPTVVPGPVYESLGMYGDDCGSDTCCPRGGRLGGHFGGGSCFTGDWCSDRPRIWFGAEYLAWWQRAHSTPPLVTSSPAGTATINSGVLGQNSTTVLYDRVPDHTRSGGRFTLGTWCPHFCNLGIEGSYFFLGRQSDSAVFGGNGGNPQVARPIFNAITAQPGSQLVDINNPDRLVLGTVTVNSFSQVWGADINLRSRLWCGPTYFVDALFGYRHLNISEGIDITENLQNFNPITRQPAGNFLVRDSFSTRNQFNGVQVGLTGEWHPHNRLFIAATTKVAMGSVYQIVNIDGSTSFSNFAPLPNATFPGGLLALPGTNIGRYTETRFGVLPEVGVKIGIDLNDHWRVWVGYDALYLNNVVRPGDQIDLRVNPNFQPSAAGPGSGVGPRLPTAVPFRTTNYWAQGLNFGLMYRY